MRRAIAAPGTAFGQAQNRGAAVRAASTPAGRILVDGGFVETAPMVIANVDVRILFETHAHFDAPEGSRAEMVRVFRWAAGTQAIRRMSDSSGCPHARRARSPRGRQVLNHQLPKTDYLLCATRCGQTFKMPFYYRDHASMRLPSRARTPSLREVAQAAAGTQAFGRMVQFTAVSRVARSARSPRDKRDLNHQPPA
jgi:hypothetical protein